jgi:hypothetical protein
MLFRFPAVFRSAAAVFSIMASFAKGGLAQKPANARPIVYNARSEVPALDRSAARSFSDKYQVVAIDPGRDFAPARLKGFDIYLPTDPRPMREANTIAKASVGYVITADGLVKDLRVLESTDKRVADFVIKQIERRRFDPAQFRGARVASLGHFQVRYGPMDDRDNSSMFKDGLGIQGMRDR